MPGLPAAMAKLQENDRVLSIDGKAVATWQELAQVIHEHPDKPMSLDVERPASSGRAAESFCIFP